MFSLSVITDCVSVAVACCVLDDSRLLPPLRHPSYHAHACLLCEDKH